MATVGDVAADLRAVQRANGLADEIKRLRSLKNWSQERLGFEAGLDHSLISRIEGYQRAATQYAISRLARALAPENDTVRVRLMMRAGYMPEVSDRLTMIRDLLPAPLADLIELVQSPALTQDVRTQLLSMCANLALIVKKTEAKEYGERAAD